MSTDYRWFTVGLDLGQRQDYTALCVMESQVYFPNRPVPQPKPLGAVGLDEVIRIVQTTQPKPETANFKPGWQSPVGYAPELLEAAVTGGFGPWPAKSPVHVRSLKRYPLGTSYPDIVADVKRLLARPELATLGATLVVDGTGVGVAVVDMFFEAGMHPVPITITGGTTVNRDEYGWRVPKRDLVGAVQAQLQTGRMHISKALPEARLLEDEMLNFRVTIDPRTAHDSYAAWREREHDDLVLSVALAAWWRETYYQHYDRALLADPQAV